MTSDRIPMKLRKPLLIASAIAALVPSVFANTFVGGEIGYVDQPVRAANTRAEVQAEYERFRKHPVLTDGTVVLQGEAGYVPANQGQSADRHPAGINTHIMGNGAAATKVAPSAPTEAERRAYREQYIN